MGLCVSPLGDEASDFWLACSRRYRCRSGCPSRRPRGRWAGASIFRDGTRHNAVTDRSGTKFFRGDLGRKPLPASTLVAHGAAIKAQGWRASLFRGRGGFGWRVFPSGSANSDRAADCSQDQSRFCGCASSPNDLNFPDVLTRYCALRPSTTDKLIRERRSLPESCRKTRKCRNFRSSLWQHWCRR